ncbi:ESX-1 secretion-associated protein EspB [Mycobacterium kansasii]|uniref:ESX-1 secretion-associated protein EspB n=3 Tax=Mycobacterium kansasii TaxID=1768 RepID=A0A653EHK7_MYCKA|nr:hypothetical protein MKAN_27520 [Mycobacterium kansasii ATCC 12478]ARG77518.1 hypothetical protein B1T51_27065 [Mycobacterium kansasii]ARG83003.1 hypothetical protein B1T52_27160 [Mycobacterium kansasii]ARG95095.1 hypothetical protein B1T50_27660 [Mycobacterium kansasii]ORC14009.1 hypothetical protein B1T46_27940 [Mycobacterium kansasii]
MSQARALWVDQSEISARADEVESPMADPTDNAAEGACASKATRRTMLSTENMRTSRMAGAKERQHLAQPMRDVATAHEGVDRDSLSSLADLFPGGLPTVPTADELTALLDFFRCLDRCARLNYEFFTVLAVAASCLALEQYGGTTGQKVSLAIAVVVCPIALRVAIDKFVSLGRTTSQNASNVRVQTKRSTSMVTALPTPYDAISSQVCNCSAEFSAGISEFSHYNWCNHQEEGSVMSQPTLTVNQSDILARADEAEALIADLPSSGVVGACAPNTSPNIALQR